MAFKLVCQLCGKEFTPIRSWQKFCSQRCQLTNYNHTHDIAGMLRAKREKEKDNGNDQE